MKRAKRYTSEAMITKDIDSALKRIEKLNKQAEAVDAEADLYALCESGENISEMREKAEVLRAKANRIKDIRLVRLKNTLSAFQTKEIPGMETGFVTLQRK